MYIISGSGNFPSVSLSKTNFESFMRHLLLVKQYRVEIFEEKNKGKMDWHVAMKVYSQALTINNIRNDINIK